MEYLSSWQVVLSKIYSIIKNAVTIAQIPQKIRSYIPTEFEVNEVKEKLDYGEFEFGDVINVVGTFSEYLPFIDVKKYLKEDNEFYKLCHTTRLDQINDVYCGAFYRLDQNNAFSNEVLPIFYKVDSKLLSHYTGEMLELECKITQIPSDYSRLLKNNDFNIFQKEENMRIPFGLNVLNVKPYGMIDSFKIHSWLLGSLEPYPKNKLGDRICANCKSSFYYMAIDPVDWPLRVGCKNLKIDGSPSMDIVEATNEFLEIEKYNKPYLIFPNKLNLFEFYCPNVDVLNQSEIEHSHGIMIEGLRTNFDDLFRTSAIPFKIELPQESNLYIDYQYDQRIKITEQLFDSSKIPEWICPNYVYDPNWMDGLSKEELEEYFKRQEKRKYKIIRKF